MNKFTVLGLNIKTKERFARGIYAPDAKTAEQDCLEHSSNDDGKLYVCAVIEGWLEKGTLKNAFAPAGKLPAFEKR